MINEPNPIRPSVPVSSFSLRISRNGIHDRILPSTIGPRILPATALIVLSESSKVEVRPMRVRAIFGLLRKTCPFCSSLDVCFSRRKTGYEKIISAILYVRPFRCRNCLSRFWRWQSSRFRRPAPARLDPVILSLGAFSAGFAALLPVFPIFAFYGLITCLIVMLTELLEPKL